ncbi:MAG: hypothetical protein ACTJFS_15820 [Micrococcaceae bacterium]
MPASEKKSEKQGDRREEKQDDADNRSVIVFWVCDRLEDERRRKAQEHPRNQHAENRHDDRLVLRLDQPHVQEGLPRRRPDRADHGQLSDRPNCTGDKCESARPRADAQDGGHSPILGQVHK